MHGAFDQVKGWAMIPANIARNNADKASTLHPDLKRLLAGMDNAGMDYQIGTAHRGKLEQEAAHKAGNSNAHFGQSPHNYLPALAMDILPYPVDFKNLNRFIEQADKVLAIAAKLKINITWGGNWHTLKDFPHFELTNWRSMHGAPV